MNRKSEREAGKNHLSILVYKWLVEIEENNNDLKQLETDRLGNTNPTNNSDESNQNLEFPPLKNRAK
jgi:hypothetical protein